MQTNNNCIVIFGASGDLTHRKLIPALYNLFKFGRLNKFSVLGVARSELNDETFREKMREALLETEETTPETLDAFCSHLYYQAVNTSDAADYGKLVPRLEELHTKYQTNGNTLYYMSTPPSLYGVIPECLAAHGLNTEEKGWKRIIVEKPFGYDEKQHKNSTSKFIVSLKNIKSIVSTIILVKKPYKTYLFYAFQMVYSNRFGTVITLIMSKLREPKPLV